VLAVSFVLGMIGGIGGGVRAGAVLFSLASTAFLIYSMVKVWNGEQHRLACIQQRQGRSEERA